MVSVYLASGLHAAMNNAKRSKGVLFLVLGLLAAAGILLTHPSWKIALLLAITIWACCRAYYVIQHYIDPDYHFASLIDFARYLFRKK